MLHNAAIVGAAKGHIDMACSSAVPDNLVPVAAQLTLVSVLHCSILNILQNREVN